MKLNEHPFDNGASRYATSILELRDANAECREHGRCAFDRSPPCGCFKSLERGGPVSELPVAAGKRRAA